MTRQELLRHALKTYGTHPEYLWSSAPEYAVLRHADNRKWYGIIMNVPRQRLGLDGQGIVDILDIKADPLISGSLLSSEGILPGYHMNKGHWITVLLDGTVDDDTIRALLDMSFDITGNKKKKRTSNGRSDWIIPANPKFYDIEKAIEESVDGVFTWKQSSNICPGDDVYIYVTEPAASLMYRCRAVETDIPYNYSDKNLNIKRVMKLRLIEKYEKHKIDRKMLADHGIYTVRGPRHMPYSLVCAVKHILENNVKN